jgi:hypothetical protein
MRIRSRRAPPELDESNRDAVFDHISFMHSFPRVIYPNSIIMLCDCLPARAATGSRDMNQDSPLRQVRMQSGAVSVGCSGGLQGGHREFRLGVLCVEQTVGGGREFWTFVEL